MSNETIPASEMRKIAMLILQNDREGAVKWAKGLTLDLESGIVSTDEEIYHLRSYGDVTKAQLDEYIKTGKISLRAIETPGEHKAVRPRNDKMDAMLRCATGPQYDATSTEAKLTQVMSDERYKMTDHEIAALVNRVRDIADKYGNTQQLRERIAQILCPVLKTFQTNPSVLSEKQID